VNRGPNPSLHPASEKKLRQMIVEYTSTNPGAETGGSFRVPIDSEERLASVIARYSDY
jgi:hypothetical protein